jgi:DNA polymerase-3 subunit epsilon
MIITQASRCREKNAKTTELESPIQKQQEKHIMPPEDNFEAMAAALEATGDYRILRRLRPWINAGLDDGNEEKIGVIVDLETTGLDASTDEVIEISCLKFSFTSDRICKVLDSFSQLNEPSIPIPIHITALTGIDDAMVKDQKIDIAGLTAFISPCDLVISHNARFDRPFAEKLCGAFISQPWACSMSEVPWQQEGFEGTKLGYLAASSGFFYDRHRAASDCEATLELLARPLPKSGVTGFCKLLETSHQTLCRVWAQNSPYDLKEVLKSRGFRWSSGDNGMIKSWYHDVAESDLQAEITFLQKEIYRREIEPHVTRLSATDRFSNRC